MMMMKQENSESDLTKKNGGEDFIVRIRGLPWSAKESDVKDFFAACEEIKAVHFTFTKEGRPTGEAYLELGSSRDVDMALLKHKENLKNRYIEVFVAKRGEMEFVLRRNTAKVPLASEAAMKDNVVRLRGLPFGCTTQDIEEFFSGLEIAPDGIVRPIDKTGRVTGEAYVKFLDKETTERALDKHMQEIGNRYIEVFRSTEGEMYIAKYPQGGGPDDELYFTDSSFGPGRKRLRGANSSGIPSLLDDIDLFESARGNGPAAGRGHGPGGSSAGSGKSSTKNYIGLATGHMVHMRGIPFKATATDIVEFFNPIKVLNILVLFDENTGKSLGEADVEFLTHEDAVEAVKKDKQHMGERYVDLFLDSVPPPEPLMDPTENFNNFPAPMGFMPFDPSTGMVQYPGHYPPANYPFGYSQYPPSYY